MNNRFSQLVRQWLRRNWPNSRQSPDDSREVAIVFVSYNTIDLTAQLLFSLFRVLGKEHFSDVVAVDNNSTDGSRELLEQFAAHGMIELIANRHQHYHGPALNQAIRFLARQQHTRSRGKKTRYIWVLDSDVIILRNDAVKDAVDFIREQGAAAIGEFQYDALPDGYAHISSLLIDPTLAWKRHIAPFDNTGAPGANFQTSLRRYDMKVCDFPYRTEHYLLHLARGTLKSIYTRDDQSNLFYQWAASHTEHHYHGTPDGRQIHKRFLELFNQEVTELTGEILLAACTKPDRIIVGLPALS
jgi:glycosyltransferase involved in cell wall biosynthesis